MAAFINNSSLPFVTDSYRMTLEYSGYFGFVSELTEMANEYGDFVHLAIVDRVAGTKVVSATFNEDEGYFLGEFIQASFDNADLIYCEQVEADGACVLVIISHGSILVDTITYPGPLSEEIVLTAFGGDAKYDVILAGGRTAVDWAEGDNHYTIPSNAILSSKRIDHGVCIEALKSSATTMAVSPSKAIKRARLQPFNLNAIAGSIAVLILAGAAFYTLTPGEAEFTAPTAKISIDRYAQYKEALHSPSPAGNILAAVQLMGKASILPGWKVKSVGISPTNLFAEMSADGGTVSDLEIFAERQGLVIRRKDKSTMMYDRRVTEMRNFPDNIYQVQDVLNHITDIANILYEADVEATEPVVDGKIFRRDVSIKIKNGIMDDVALMAEALADLPIVLKDIHGQPNDDSIDFTIQLTIYGEHVISS